MAARRRTELGQVAGQLDLTLYGGALISSNVDDNVDALGFERRQQLVEEHRLL